MGSNCPSGCIELGTSSGIMGTGLSLWFTVDLLPFPKKVKLFVVIVLGVLICTRDIACGRKLLRKENISVAHGEGTSNLIGCFKGDVICASGHEYNNKESVKKHLGDMFKGGNGKNNDVISGQSKNKNSLNENCYRNIENNKNINSPRESDPVLSGNIGDRVGVGTSVNSGNTEAEGSVSEEANNSINELSSKNSYNVAVEMNNENSSDANQAP
ncbi:hypothetical protein LXL04_037405 [Taraxacum kok-saghyz]